MTFFIAKIPIFSEKICLVTIFLNQEQFFFSIHYDYCQKYITFVPYYKKHVDMENKDLNRLKVVLAEKKRTNKWLAEQIGKDPATVSKWCTNAAQPNLESLMEIARCLEVNLDELVRFDALQQTAK